MDRRRRLLGILALACLITACGTDRSVVNEVTPAAGGADGVTPLAVTQVVQIAASPDGSATADVSTQPIETPTEVTPSPTPTSTATASPSPTPTSTPTSTPTPTPTPTLEPTPVPFVEVITIQASSQSGVRFVAPVSGGYEFRIEGGAYSPKPDGVDGPDQWRTLLYLFHNRNVEWGDRGYGLLEPFNPDAQLGLWEAAQFPDQVSAEAAARGHAVELSLVAGDAVTIVAIDERDAYTSFGLNRGAMTVRVTLVRAASAAPVLGTPSHAVS